MLRDALASGGTSTVEEIKAEILQRLRRARARRQTSSSSPTARRRRRPRRRAPARSARRADRDRPLASRPRVDVLRRHDAHVRLRQALGRAQRVVPARLARAPALARRDPGRRHRPRGLQGRCEIFEAPAPDASEEARKVSRSRTGSSTGSATASGSRCTRRRRSGRRRRPLVAGDVVSVEPGLYRPGYGGCASRTSAS